MPKKGNSSSLGGPVTPRYPPPRSRRAPLPPSPYGGRTDNGDVYASHEVHGVYGGSYASHGGYDYSGHQGEEYWEGHDQSQEWGGHAQEEDWGTSALSAYNSSYVAEEGESTAVEADHEDYIERIIDHHVKEGTGKILLKIRWNNSKEDGSEDEWFKREDFLKADETSYNLMLKEYEERHCLNVDEATGRLRCSGAGSDRRGEVENVVGRDDASNKNADGDDDDDNKVGDDQKQEHEVGGDQEEEEEEKQTETSESMEALKKALDEAKRDAAEARENVQTLEKAEKESMQIRSELEEKVRVAEERLSKAQKTIEDNEAQALEKAKSTSEEERAIVEKLEGAVKAAEAEAEEARDMLHGACGFLRA